MAYSFEEVDSIIENLAPYNEELRRLLVYSLGRVLLKKKKDEVPVDADSDETDFFKWLLREEDERFIHIRDWLQGALVRNEPWLTNLDSEGRPKKLMKFSSVEGILKEADKAMMKFANRHRNVVINDGHEELVEELENGWRVVRLLTPDALIQESGQMQHCIGQGAYDDRVVSDKYLYYSLRDPSGKAHVTAELIKDPDTKKSCALQIQGKQNMYPLIEYVRMIAPVIRKRGFAIPQGVIQGTHVVDVEGNVHAVDDIPDGCVLDRLVLNGKNLRLPANLTVRGMAVFDNCVLELPSVSLAADTLVFRTSRIVSPTTNLQVKDQCILKDTVCQTLAESVEFTAGSALTIEGLCPREIPLGLDERHSLTIDANGKNLDRIENLHQFKRLKSLKLVGIEQPTEQDIQTLLSGGCFENLSVAGHPIHELPRDLVVTNTLELVRTGLARLPDGLSLTGDLDIEGNPITELPKNMSVGGHFFALATGIVSIPDDAKFGGAITLAGSPVTSLGSIRKVEGSLNIAGTKLQHLPSGLTVSGNLMASQSGLVSIGSNVTVAGSFTCRHGFLKEIPSDMKIGRSVDVSGSAFEKLPDGFVCDGSLDLADTKISVLPEGLHVKGELRLSGTNIASFPENVYVEGDLEIHNMKYLQKLPSSLTVEGAIQHPNPQSIYPYGLQRMIHTMQGEARRSGAKP